MLFVVFGQPKSASTFLSRMTRYTCEAAGSDQDSVKARVLTGPLEGKRQFWGGELFPIPAVADRLNPGEHMSIKTHATFRPLFKKTFARDDIQVLLSYRHPGDAALSAFEAGARARQNGQTNRPYFSSLTSHRVAIEKMANYVQNVVTPWLQSGLALPFSYHQVTREAPKVLETLRQRIGVSQAALDANADLSDLLSGQQRTYNFNKGVSGRHTEVFSQADLDYLHERCDRFIAFCEGEIAASEL